MKRLWMISVLLWGGTLLAADGNPFLGRWDLTITSNGDVYPDWMEVTEENGNPKVRVQLRTGNVHPLEAKMDGSRLIVTVPPPNDAPQSGPIGSWELIAKGDEISGVQKQGGAEDGKVAGHRAPALKREAPRAWTAPESLFNGKDLTGWKPINNTPPTATYSKSRWTANNGELMKDGVRIFAPSIAMKGSPDRFISRAITMAEFDTETSRFQFPNIDRPIECYAWL